MAWFCPDKYKVNLPNPNEEFLKLKGELSDKQARVTLAKFLKSNIEVAVFLLSGIRLFPFQSIILRAWLNRNFSMNVMCRGAGKSWLVAVFIFLYLIFNPGAKMIICGATFRTSKLIFEKLKEIVYSPGAKLLAQVFCDEYKAEGNSLNRWNINSGSVICLPMGERIRGFRADVLLIEEFLIMPMELMQDVIFPFLAADLKAGEHLQIRQEEDELIKIGAMKEEDRKVLKNNVKMIGISSAGYTFDYLYKLFKEWEEKIYSNEPVKEATYFISQLSYEALPKELISAAVIEEASSGGANNSNFRREYMAQWDDGSDGYFSAKKMAAVTMKPGEMPNLEIWGDKDSDYILAIDPSFSNAPNSDDFAMCVLKLINKVPHVIHQYAVAGGDLKDHINYFCYLIKAFNPKLIIADTTGGDNFFESVNLSEYFLDNKIEYKPIKFESDKEGTEEYSRVLREARNSYNLQNHRICIEQVFTSDFIRKANEHLQASFDHRTIWFGSKITPDDGVFKKVSAQNVPFKTHTKFNDVIEMIDQQDLLIENTKKQCALIEVKSTAKGTQTFDLPVHLKKSTAVDRARRDSYSALFLANWAAKIYNDLMSSPVEDTTETFVPRIIK